MGTTKKTKSISKFAAPASTAGDVAIKNPSKNNNPNSQNLITSPGVETAADYDINIRQGSADYGFTQYDNPEDNLTGRKGLEIYDKMMTDGVVRGAINAKRYAICAGDWEIAPATDSPADIEIANFVKFSLKDMKGSLGQTIFQILHALVFGYSIAEMNFKEIDRGKWHGKWGFLSIRGRPPHKFEFVLDEFGNILKLKQDAGRGAIVELPLNKFIIYNYESEYDRPFGTSDLRSAYKHWWSKDFLLKWWNVYLETFGIPSRVGYFPAGASPTQQAQLKAVLKSILNATAMTVPDNLKIDFLDVAAGGGDAFDKAIKYHDRKIVELILGQTLTSTQGDGSGSFALGEVHADTKNEWISSLRNDVAETVITERIIKTLVNLNFPVVENYPIFTFIPPKLKISIANPTELISLANLGILTNKDMNVFRDRFDLPPSALFENPDEIFLPQISLGGAPVNAPATSGTLPGTVEIDEPEKPGEIEKPDNSGESDGGKVNIPEGFSKYQSDTNKLWKPARALFSSENRLGGIEYFSKQIAERDKIENSVVKKLSPIFEKLKDKFLITVKKNVFSGNSPDPKAIKNLTLPSAEIKNISNIIGKSSRNIFEQQYVNGLKNTNQNKNSIPQIEIASFAAVKVGLTPMIPVEIVAKLKKLYLEKDFVDIRELRTKLLAQLGNNNEKMSAWWITNVTDTQILSQAKNVLMSGITNNISEAEIQAKLANVFEPYIAREGHVALGSAQRLECIVRTNTTRAWASAHVAAYRDPVVMTAFPGIQFSAVLDAVTTPYCQSMNGKIFKADDPAADSLIPGHFECRSDWIPCIFDDPQLEKNGFSTRADVPLNLMSREFGGEG